LKSNAVGLTSSIVMSVILMSPGVSVYINGPVIAGSVGPAVPLIFLLAMLAILPTGWALAQYSRKISSAGSYYAFVERAAGRTWAFLTGWALFGAYGLLAIGGSASFGGYVAMVAHQRGWGSFSWFWPTVIGAIIAVLLSIRGIKASEVASIIMLGIEMVLLLVVSIVVFITGGNAGFSAKPFLFSAVTGGVSSVRLALIFGVLSFIGFSVSASLAEETKDPTRTVPRAILGGIVAIGVVLIVCSYAAVLGYGVSHTGQFAGDAAAIDTLTDRYLGGISVVADLIIFNSIFGAVLSSIHRCDGVVSAS